MIEYQKETRKKIMENQYRLKGILTNIKGALSNKLGLSEEEKKKILSKVQQVEENGEYQDILKIVEATKTDSFKEFKQLLQAQMQETEKLRLESRKEVSKMSEEELQASVKELDDQLKTIEQYKKEYLELGRNIEDTEGTHIILTGIKRNIVLNVIRYYDTHALFYDGVTIHPESLETLNEVNYLVDNNLPVAKELLYEIAPELFEYEVEQLAEIKKQELRYRHERILQYSDDSIIKGFDRKTSVGVNPLTPEYECRFC
jgi:hypothetical protein